MSNTDPAILAVKRYEEARAAAKAIDGTHDKPGDAAWDGMWALYDEIIKTEATTAVGLEWQCRALVEQLENKPGLDPDDELALTVCRGIDRLFGTIEERVERLSRDVAEVKTQFLDSYGKRGEEG